VSVSARPVVLAPLALRATGTLNAGRGPRAGRARRRVLRPRLAELLGLAALEAFAGLNGSGLSWVQSCERAHAPCHPGAMPRDVGGLSRRLRRLGGMLDAPCVVVVDGRSCSRLSGAAPHGTLNAGRGAKARRARRRVLRLRLAEPRRRVTTLAFVMLSSGLGSALARTISSLRPSRLLVA